MITKIRNGMCLALVLIAPGLAWGWDAATAMVGIDHVPVVVENLEEAEASYRRLGFSLKPGRVHANGLRNSHIKFKDGSGIELISPPAQPGDELTRVYSRFLRDGQGPAFLSFHARDWRALTSALARSDIGFVDENGLLTLVDPRLDFIFFVRDNRSPTDRPEHLVHANTAVAMPEVWLALDRPGRESLRGLLLALGAVASRETVRVPGKARAEVFTVNNGRVVVVAGARQTVPGRPILGVQFRVQDPGAAKKHLAAGHPWVAPLEARGLWLRFEGPR